MVSLKRSWDDFAPKIKRFGLKFPHGVLKVAIFLDSGSSRSWWWPCIMSSLEKMMQSWNLYIKSPTTVSWVILCLSMFWLGTLRSTLALIMCGSRFSFPSRKTLALVELQGVNTKLLVLLQAPPRKSLLQCIVLTILWVVFVGNKELV